MFFKIKMTILGSKKCSMLVFVLMFYKNHFVSAYDYKNKSPIKVLDDQKNIEPFEISNKR